MAEQSLKNKTVKGVARSGINSNKTQNNMKTKVYAPVMIPTLNRYEHFKRCLESLERCTDADKTDVYVGLDYPPSEKYVEGWKKIDAYLTEKEKKHGFKNLYVRRRDHNCGIGHSGSNGNLLLQEIVPISDKYISTEDDNEFSPCFLEFMNLSFEKYKSESRIAQISGYKSPVLQVLTNKNVFCNVDSPVYGLGRWKDKDRVNSTSYKFIEKELKQSFGRLWRLFWIYPAIIYKAIRMIEKESNYGDVSLSVLNLLNESFTLCPSISLARNWGCDGSGLHSGIDRKKQDEVISTDSHFDIDEIEIGLNDSVRKSLRYLNMPHGRLSYYLHLVYYLLVTIRFYLKK